MEGDHSKTCRLFCKLDDQQCVDLVKTLTLQCVAESDKDALEVHMGEFRDEGFPVHVSLNGEPLEWKLVDLLERRHPDWIKRLESIPKHEMFMNAVPTYVGYSFVYSVLDQ